MGDVRDWARTQREDTSAAFPPRPLITDPTPEEQAVERFDAPLPEDEEAEALALDMRMVDWDQRIADMGANIGAMISDAPGRIARGAEGLYGVADQAAEAALNYPPKVFADPIGEARKAGVAAGRAQEGLIDLGKTAATGDPEAIRDAADLASMTPGTGPIPDLVSAGASFAKAFDSENPGEDVLWGTLSLATLPLWWLSSDALRKAAKWGIVQSGPAQSLQSSLHNLDNKMTNQLKKVDDDLAAGKLTPEKADRYRTQIETEGKRLVGEAETKYTSTSAREIERSQRLDVKKLKPQGPHLLETLMPPGAMATFKAYPQTSATIQARSVAEGINRRLNAPAWTGRRITHDQAREELRQLSSYAEHAERQAGDVVGQTQDSALRATESRKRGPISEDPRVDSTRAQKTVQREADKATSVRQGPEYEKDKISGTGKNRVVRKIRPGARNNVERLRVEYRAAKREARKDLAERRTAWNKLPPASRGPEPVMADIGPEPTLGPDDYHRKGTTPEPYQEGAGSQRMAPESTEFEPLYLRRIREREEFLRAKRKAEANAYDPIEAELQRLGRRPGDKAAKSARYQAERRAMRRDGQWNDAELAVIDAHPDQLIEERLLKLRQEGKRVVQKEDGTFVISGERSLLGGADMPEVDPDFLKSGREADARMGRQRGLVSQDPLWRFTEPPTPKVDRAKLRAQRPGGKASAERQAAFNEPTPEPQVRSESGPAGPDRNVKLSPEELSTLRRNQIRQAKPLVSGPASPADKLRDLNTQIRDIEAKLDAAKTLERRFPGVDDGTLQRELRYDLAQALDGRERLLREGRKPQPGRFDELEAEADRLLAPDAAAKRKVAAEKRRARLAEASEARAGKPGAEAARGGRRRSLEELEAEEQLRASEYAGSGELPPDHPWYTHPEERDAMLADTAKFEQELAAARAEAKPSGGGPAASRRADVAKPKAAEDTYYRIIGSDGEPVMGQNYIGPGRSFWGTQNVKAPSNLVPGDEFELIGPHGVRHKYTVNPDGKTVAKSSVPGQFKPGAAKPPGGGGVDELGFDLSTPRGRAGRAEMDEADRIIASDEARRADVAKAKPLFDRRMTNEEIKANHAAQLAEINRAHDARVKEIKDQSARWELEREQSRLRPDAEIDADILAAKAKTVGVDIKKAEAEIKSLSDELDQMSLPDSFGPRFNAYDGLVEQISKKKQALKDLKRVQAKAGGSRRADVAKAAKERKAAQAEIDPDYAAHQDDMFDQAKRDSFPTMSESEVLENLDEVKRTFKDDPEAMKEIARIEGEFRKPAVIQEMDKSGRYPGGQDYKLWNPRTDSIYKGGNVIQTSAPGPSDLKLGDMFETKYHDGSPAMGVMRAEGVALYPPDGWDARNLSNIIKKRHGKPQLAFPDAGGEIQYLEDQYSMGKRGWDEGPGLFGGND